MNQCHQLKISNRSYSKTVRFLECDHCDYALAVEVDRKGVVKLDSRIKINKGDANAAHTFYQQRGS